MKLVQKPADVPIGHHYAIIDYKSVKMITESYDYNHNKPFDISDGIETSHYITLSKAEWLKEIEHRENSRSRYSSIKNISNYVAFEVAGLAQIKTSTKVEVVDYEIRK